MKILYVLNNTMEYAGTESVVLNYFKYLQSKDFCIDFMLHTTEEESNNNEICRYLRQSGSKIHCVTPRKVSLKQNIKDIQNILRREHYDIIHSHADCISGFILQIAKNENVSIRIAHSHNTQSEVSGGRLKRKLHLALLELCKWNLRRVATHYMACSKAAGKWLFGKKLLESDNIYILRNAIECEKFKYNQDIRNKIRMELGLDNCFVIGHVGRFCYQKNHEFLINAFVELKLKDPTAKLLLVGKGELEEKIQRLVREKKLEESVIFYGVSNQVNELLQAMDLFVLPSRFEGLSVVLIEAQAAGLPCIVTESDKISNETNITPLIKHIATDNYGHWASEMLALKGSTRKDQSDVVKAAGYDLKNESDKLRTLYLDMYSRMER